MHIGYGESSRVEQTPASQEEHFALAEHALQGSGVMMDSTASPAAMSELVAVDLSNVTYNRNGNRLPARKREDMTAEDLLELDPVSREIWQNLHPSLARSYLQGIQSALRSNRRRHNWSPPQ